MLGLIGLKVGMSRFFNQEGVSIPVTLIQATHNRVVQIKKKAKEGYDAVQLTFGCAPLRYSKSEALEKEIIQEGQRLPKRSKFVKLPQKGHFERHACQPGRVLREFRVTEEELDWLQSHPTIGLEIFENCREVDVTGKSKGKGFAGVIKRWNFSSQPASHGNSLSHRAPGSIGQNQTPGRVFKGKKMAGHLGCERVTIQGLEIVHIDLEQSLLLVKGAVPGTSGGLVLIKPSEKRLQAHQAA